MDSKNPMRLLAIVNPISGRTSKARVWESILGNIDTTKYEVAIEMTQRPGHATELAAKAVEDGVEVVAAVGGDGTVNEVAKALVGTSTALGIIPCGSGNGLARHLHIPMDVRKAVQIINEGTAIAIDSMTVNGIPCFCTMGVGYDAKVCEEYSKESTRGFVTYARKFIGGWFSYEPQEYIIVTDEKVLERKAVAITCANANQWGNGFHVAPKASLRDGLIDVTIIHPIKLVNAIPMPAQILGYSFDKNPDVETFKAKNIMIKRRTTDAIHVDGEPMHMGKDVRVEIRKESLSIMINTSANQI